MKKRLLAMVFVSSVMVLFSNALSAQTIEKMEKKLRTIMIEHMVVEDASVQAVINLLRMEAKRSDSMKKGINIVTFLEDPKKKRVKKSKAKKEEEDFLLEEDLTEGKVTKEVKEGKTITLMLDDVSLGEAIKNICMVAELKYRVEEYAVVIAHKNYALDPVKTKMYPVPPEVFLEIKKRLKSGK